MRCTEGAPLLRPQLRIRLRGSWSLRLLEWLDRIYLPAIGACLLTRVVAGVEQVVLAGTAEPLAGILVPNRLDSLWTVGHEAPYPTRNKAEAGG